MSTDILVVGGGVGGAVLAALLVLGGRTVTVLERSTKPPAFLRPEILWPAAVQTLCGLRDRAFWERQCIRPLAGISLHRGGEWQDVITRSVLEQAGVQPFLTHPNHLRETLLAICGANLRRGVEVTEILRGNGTVTGARARDLQGGESFSVTASLTVGDDGTRSAVRAACGIGIHLHPFPVEFLVRGVAMPQNMHADVVKLWLAPREDRSGLLAFGMMPLPGPEAACIAIVRTPQADDTAALTTALAGLFPRSEDAPVPLDALAFPQGFTRIRREWGHAASYGAPGAVLLGDALHPVSPAGGQGANMAIADAAVLARLILGNEPDLIPAYEAARRRANERGIRPSRMAAQMFAFTGVPMLGALPAILIPKLLARPSLIAALLRSIAHGSANS
jgi:2-polyprenyl-6-methoxyphenol hydroxylase-like FAD-dependent oxidoreductase